MEENFEFEGWGEKISPEDVFAIIFDVSGIPDGKEEPEPIIVIVLKNGANIKLAATEINISNARRILALKKGYSI